MTTETASILYQSFKPPRKLQLVTNLGSLSEAPDFNNPSQTMLLCIKGHCLTTVLLVAFELSQTYGLARERCTNSTEGIATYLTCICFSVDRVLKYE